VAEQLAIVSAEEFFGRVLKITASRPTAVSAESKAIVTEAPADKELLEFISNRLTNRDEPVGLEPAIRAEPIAQGQPIPSLKVVPPEKQPTAEKTQITEPRAGAPEQVAPAASAGTALAGVITLRHFVETFSSAPKAGASEETANQSTASAIMPETTQQMPPAPIILPPRNAPMTGGAAQPEEMQPGASSQPQTHPTGGAMQTAVQLTFSCEIAFLQLTPAFKMGGLQLKPTSKIVTMRLAPSLHPQPGMNLQVTFEIASVQLEGNSIGTIRLTPSQQQRPGMIGSPSFNIAALQLVSGEKSAPVQITASQQGQSFVHLTAPFQIATVEFSPSFEIAAIVLNASSSTVSVQLPGADQNGEGAPMFEVSNVELSEGGEIEMMQLNPAERRS